MPTSTYQVQFEHADAIDPSQFMKIAQLVTAEVAAIASKNVPLAISTGLQLATAIAAMFIPIEPLPDPVPLPPGPPKAAFVESPESEVLTS